MSINLAIDEKEIPAIILIRYVYNWLYSSMNMKIIYKKNNCIFVFYTGNFSININIKDMRKLLTISFFLFYSGSAAQVNLDSLWNVWNDTSQADTNRLKAINDIAWKGHLFTRPDSAFYYAQMEYDFAQSTGNRRWMASALNTQGAYFYFKSDYEKAIEYYEKSLKSQSRNW